MPCFVTSVSNSHHKQSLELLITKSYIFQKKNNEDLGRILQGCGISSLELQSGLILAQFTCFLGVVTAQLKEDCQGNARLIALPESTMHFENCDDPKNCSNFDGRQNTVYIQYIIYT